MKKLFAILLVVCMLASALGINAFAAGTFSNLIEFDEVPMGVVLRISGLKNDDTLVTIKDYNDFEDGWEAAVDYAEDDDFMEEYDFERIVVDLCDNWTANAEGEFGDGGDGFEYSTIDIPGDIKMTINMNNFTIDRGLKVVEYDGEVIHISGDADVIINNGTITGGKSENGAGGIHIKGDATVTLNNVNIVGNKSRSSGGGIEVGKGSTLTVNGGSFKDNTIIGSIPQYYGNAPEYYGGAVYVSGGTAVFNGVEFKNNNATNEYNYGAAVCVENGDATISDCIFDGNGVKSEENDAALSIVHGINSVIRVIGSTFTGNGGEITGSNECDYSGIFALKESKLVVNSSSFSGNLSYFIFNDEEESSIKVSDTKFLNNTSAIMRGNEDTAYDSFFKTSTFENNGKYEGYSFYDVVTILTFYDCSMGDSTYSPNARIKFLDNAPESDVVLSISVLKKDGTTETIGNYNSFEKGWNTAMELAIDSDTIEAKGYDRFVIDICDNWNANDGQFTEAFHNGKGFNWDAIYIQPNVRITLNLNGFTIDRALDDWEGNGEVIYIDDNADVIINNGTITGGNSDNGAGGIHISDGANVTLNNVHIVANEVCADDGAGIAMYGGATLTVNGGSFRDNVVRDGQTQFDYTSGTVYIENGVAVFNNVEFNHNTTFQYYGGNTGIVIHAKNSRVLINNCIFDDNGIMDGKTETYDVPDSSLEFDSCDVIIKDSTFTNDDSYNLIDYDSSTLTIDNCVITNNKCNTLIDEGSGSALYVSNTKITDNESQVFSDESWWGAEDSYFKNCVFNNNNGPSASAFVLGNTLTFYECDLGDSTFANPEYAVFEKTQAPAGFPTQTASIFSDGSSAILVSIFALVASVASIGISFALYKKKAIAEKK